jgi:chemotaxis methyl-accepting protein methylase
MGVLVRRRCEYDPTFQWLTGLDEVNYHTLTDFWVERRQEFPSGVVRICDIGCSTGTEVYSVLWMLCRRFPQISVSMLAMDLSAEAIEHAQAGRYKADSLVFRGRMDQPTRDDIFYREGYEFVVKPCLREGI